MKQSLFVVSAACALAGTVLLGVDLVGAGQPRAGDSLGSQPYGELAQSTDAGHSPSTPLNYATSFEPEEGFTARDGTCVQNACASGEIGDGSGGTGYTGECGFIGDGTQGSGPYPEPWGTSTANAGNIEGHIDNVHPFSGSQHLRLSKDACDETSLSSLGFVIDARVPIPAAREPGIWGPSTYSGQIAITQPPFGANVYWMSQSQSQGLRQSIVQLGASGSIEVLDNLAMHTIFYPTFAYWDQTGGYQAISVHHDPCDNFRCLYGGPKQGLPCPNGDVDCGACVGGDHDALPCVGSFQCPGGACHSGRCAGRIDYYYGGKLIYVGANWGGTTSETLVIYTNNLPGTVDIDDVWIETGEPCPATCGNLEIENSPGDEWCDGGNDSLCPERCVPPGETGPDGEPECTCIIDGETCAQASPLPNDTTNLTTHGGWWTFVADAPAYAVDTCGSDDVTRLTVWTGACDALELVGVNNACHPGYEGADPLASCYGEYDGSCTCFPTTLGQQYWVQLEQESDHFWGILGNVTNITVSKRLDCGAIWENGACCDRVTGTCDDGVAPSDCTGEGEAFTLNKLCTSVECAPALGACCDRGPGLDGPCVETTFSDCQNALQDWTLDTACADVNCEEARGACCDGITGNCLNGVFGTPCTGQNQAWTPDANCAQVTCDPIPGACLDHFNPNPKSRECLCTNGVIQADCQGDKLEWVKGASCSAVQPDCSANFNRIPTVSDWGMVILALVLVILAKLTFGYARAGRAVVDQLR